jgi:carboxyl-terminal processing protease
VLLNVRMRLAVAGFVSLTACCATAQQTFSKFDRERVLEMLNVIGRDVRVQYYDPKFHGVNWDSNLAEMRQKIEQAPSLNMALADIAAALDKLNDSHTFFLPPQHVASTDYGFQYQLVGDHCFVTRVRPGSDAESQGVRAGDEVLAINGYQVTRNTQWKMEYTYSVLRPQPGLRLTLKDPAGRERKLDVAAKIHTGERLTYAPNSEWEIIRAAENQQHLVRTRYLELGDAVLVVKLQEFLYSEVESMIAKARKFPNLILDLRGNPGGSAEALKHMVGAMFDRDVEIDQRVTRKDTKPEIAKKAHNSCSGKIVVLVDSKSGSAAEMFARIVQLEKRGIVVGDRSAGAVMEAERYTERYMEGNTAVFYGASITVADVIMSDGKSLEHTGVTPDDVLLPTATDLATGKDPVLAHAVETFGVKLSPEDAGKAFPYEE